MSVREVMSAHTDAISGGASVSVCSCVSSLLFWSEGRINPNADSKKKSGNLKIRIVERKEKMAVEDKAVCDKKKLALVMKYLGPRRQVLTGIQGDQVN